MANVFIGIGSNLGSPAANVRRAIRELADVVNVERVSRLYRTKPWGVADQPEFVNAVASVTTHLEPIDLLDALKAMEQRLGRTRGARWGPRVIDLDILLYDDRRIELAELTLPHPRMSERAFVLVPLSELDPRFERDAAGLPAAERESVSLMSDDPVAGRVRALAEAFLETDLMRLRIEEENEDAVELRRKSVAAPRRAAAPPAAESAPPPVVPDTIKADLVGIFHFARPVVAEGDTVESDRELAYVEALGIRNPVRSLGAGRIVAVHCKDGDPVDYGRVLFEIARV